MLPLDPDFLLFLKFFVVLTCFFFWIRLGYNALMAGHRRRRRYRVGPHHHKEGPPQD